MLIQASMENASTAATQDIFNHCEPFNEEGDEMKDHSQNGDMDTDRTALQCSPIPYSL